MGADVRIVTDKDWERLCAQYRYCCAYCGEKKKLTQDHIVPLDQGGRHSVGNLIPACKRCNTKKANKMLTTWKKDEIKQRIRARTHRMNNWPPPDDRQLHIVKCRGKHTLAAYSAWDDGDEHYAHYSSFSDAAMDWQRHMEKGSPYKL